MHGGSHCCPPKKIHSQKACFKRVSEKCQKVLCLFQVSIKTQESMPARELAFSQDNSEMAASMILIWQSFFYVQPFIGKISRNFQCLLEHPGKSEPQGTLFCTPMTSFQPASADVTQMDLGSGKIVTVQKHGPSAGLASQKAAGSLSQTLLPPVQPGTPVNAGGAEQRADCWQSQSLCSPKTEG